MDGLPMGPCPGVLEGAVVGGEGKSLALIDPLSPPTTINKKSKYNENKKINNNKESKYNENRQYS